MFFFLIFAFQNLTRFAHRNPLGCDYSTLRATICCKTRDRSICGLLPQIAPFLMHALTRPARRDFYPRYVRPTSVRIKGATPCLHFVRGVTNLITNKWGQHYCRPHLFVISSRGYPTHRGCHLRADRHLRYLLSFHRPISMMLQALTLPQRLPLLQEVMYNSISYVL